MNITDLRTEFKDRSGRKGMTNAEIDLWFDWGSSHLDRLSGFINSPASLYVSLSIGDYRKEFTLACRTITDVWLLDSTAGAGRTEIKKAPLWWLREQYPDPNVVTKGTPLYYAPTVVRSADTTVRSTPGVSAYAHLIDEITSGEDYRGIIVLPPNDIAQYLEVTGKFYSPALSDSVTTNWWSDNHPDTLVAAALYKLQIIQYRSTEAAKDYAAEIATTLTSIDYDMAEDEMAGIERMEG